jgi:multidrug efflux pump subunit AcrB
LESAAGQFSEGARELRVRLLGEATAVEELGNILILRRGGQIIHGSNIKIKDVAKVEDGLSDIRRIARYEGQPTVSLRISKQRGTNEVDVAKAIQSQMNILAKDFPEGFGYRVNVDFTKSTEATVKLTQEGSRKCKPHHHFQLLINIPVKLPQSS